MTSSVEPLVSVITPVFNGEKYLQECIESVLGQSYQNWNYVIVNNCSTDRTREIGERYASQDSRIRVHTGESFVTAIQNHNIGFRLIAQECKYCKVVHADDWIFPECLAQMVALAETNPSSGVVGAYGLEGDRVVWDGLPYPSGAVSGRDVSRRHLMGGSNVFGSPTSVLFRADLIRRRHSFYREEYPLWADLDACLDVLQECDYGFVHQVLTFTRWHDEATSSFAWRMNSYVVGQLEILKRYGPIYLNHDEYHERLQKILHRYRRFLGRSVFTRPNDREFWKYHMSALRELGHPISRPALLAEAATAAVALLAYPARAIANVLGGKSDHERGFPTHSPGSPTGSDI